VPSTRAKTTAVSEQELSQQTNWIPTPTKEVHMSRALRPVQAMRAAVSGAATLVAGSYTIGQFQDCGLATLLINTTIPGSGDTVKFTLGKAKLG
jgi:hypothetical protein